MLYSGLGEKLWGGDELEEDPELVLRRRIYLVVDAVLFHCQSVTACAALTAGATPTPPPPPCAGWARRLTSRVARAATTP